MRRGGNGRPRPPVTAEVAALRRRVLRIRLGVALAALVIAAGWFAYWDVRTAAVRRPEVALADGSPVYAAGEAYLISQSAQLTLRATVTDFSRTGRPGPLAPHNATRQGNTSTYFLQVSGYGSVNDTGAPVVGPVETVITGHTLGRGDKVSRITLECTYEFCWDRKAPTARRIALGEEMPAIGSGETVDGRILRYTVRERVTDRLVLGFVNRKGRWEVVQVQRLVSVRVTSK